MSAKVRNKLKGMIFSDRPSRRARPPGSPLASSRDDSRSGLISHTRREGSSQDQPDQEDSDGIREEEPTTEPQAGSGHAPGDKPRLQWQYSVRQRVTGGPRRPHDSTSHIHINVSGGQGDAPNRHYMQTQNSTPVRMLDRKTSAPRGQNGDQRLLLNVGGVRHETHVSTLRNVPSSRLSRLAEWHATSGGGRLEYFFDRHPAVFNSIIDFYRTGEWRILRSTPI